MVSPMLSKLLTHDCNPIRAIIKLVGNTVIVLIGETAYCPELNNLTVTTILPAVPLCSVTFVQLMIIRN